MQQILLRLTLHGCERGPFSQQRRILTLIPQTQSQVAWKQKEEHNTTQSPGSTIQQQEQTTTTNPQNVGKHTR